MLVGIFVIIAAAAYLYYFTTLPESELNGWINSLIPGEEELIVNVERVNRDIWDELILEGVSIAPKIKNTAPKIEISKIQLSYDPVKLFKDRSSFNKLIIDSININIPKFSKTDTTTKSDNDRTEFPDKANIELLEVRNVSVTIHDNDKI